MTARLQNCILSLTQLSSTCFHSQLLVALALAASATATNAADPIFDPQSPGLFDASPKANPSPAANRVPEPALPESPLPVSTVNAAAPGQFNPDPGGGAATPGQDVQLFTTDPLPLPDYGTAPLPPEQAQPQPFLLRLLPFLKRYNYRHYGPTELPPHSEAVPNRWWIGFGQWKRYMDPSTETPYMHQGPLLFHPYLQSTLKGDAPLIGEDIFGNLTLRNFSLFEYRLLPTPSGISAAQPNSSEFFGRGEQLFFSNDTSISFDLFKGETSFKPVDWLLHFTGVYNRNVIRVEENNQIDPDPRGVGYVEPAPAPSAIGVTTRSGDVNPILAKNTQLSVLQPGAAVPVIRSQPSGLKPATTSDLAGTRYTTRMKDFFALEEAYAEIHIRDLSDNYDFVSSRIGIQPFTSDFRGFIFSDSNLGARIFGNADDNRWQYNLALFHMLEKDTYSDLNTFDFRHQNIAAANVYEQDFLTRGYTAEWSVLANFDDGGTYYDKNGFLTRPALLGTVKPHQIESVYLGWAGDGHIGKVNITHAVYEVVGQDQFNELAGRRVFINAQMAALELSIDHDWIRFKLSGFYASGDAHPTDGTARGFDSVLDNPEFIGGPFSWYAHEGVNLAGTAVNLKQRDSLVPDLRSAKSEGQSNFVNPGAFIAGAGVTMDVTPKLRSFTNINHIWLAEIAPIQTALHTNRAANDLGWDLSTGIQYRPLLTENVIFSAGVGFLLPGEGYRDIYRHNSVPVANFGNPGHVDSFLYNVFATLTLTY